LESSNDELHLHEEENPTAVNDWGEDQEVVQDEQEEEQGNQRINSTGNELA
jgi:hypothetical protein